MLASVKHHFALGFALLGLALVSPAANAVANDGPVGRWDLTTQIGSRINASTLTVTEEDGQLKAIIKSDQGERELQNVSFADGVLKFVITFENQGQSLTLNFSGTIDGDQLDGHLSSDAAEFSVSGKRAGTKHAAIGTWELMVDSPLGNNSRQLVIKADLSGSYGGGGLPTFPLENVRLEGETATMDVTLQSDQGELPCSITLKIAGETATGTLDYGEGEATMVGKRAKNPMVGSWKLIVDSQLGQNERELTIRPDRTGTYGGGDFPKFPISNLQVDGNTATMDVELEFQGETYPVTITLKIDGDKVTGSLDYGQGDASIEGKRE